MRCYRWKKWILLSLWRQSGLSHRAPADKSSHKSATEEDGWSCPQTLISGQCVLYPLMDQVRIDTWSEPVGWWFCLEEHHGPHFQRWCRCWWLSAASRLSLLDVSFQPECFIIRKDINRLIKSQQWSWADSWRRECDQTDPYQSAGALHLCVHVTASAHMHDLHRSVYRLQPSTNDNNCSKAFSSTYTFVILIHNSSVYEAHRHTYVVQSAPNAIQQSSNTPVISARHLSRLRSSLQHGGAGTPHSEGPSYHWSRKIKADCGVLMYLLGERCTILALFVE